MLFLFSELAQYKLPTNELDIALSDGEHIRQGDVVIVHCVNDTDIKVYENNPNELVFRGNIVNEADFSRLKEYRE